MFKQCEALTKKNNHCPNGAVKGDVFCHVHVGKDYDVTAPRVRCGAITRKGKACSGWAVAGTSVCLLHSPHERGVAKVEAGRGAVEIAYRKYLLSPSWKRKREKRLIIDGYACVLCHSTDRLEVHHLTYKRLGHERNYDLRTLCHDCHDAVSDAERTLGWHEANAVFYENTRRGKKRERQSISSGTRINPVSIPERAGV